jgi:uncharacterized protein (TIGR02145 family)
MKKRVYLLAGLLFFLISNCEQEDPGSILPVNIGTVTDIEGNTYKTIKIGDQWWMTENLRTTRYRNGDSISFVTESYEWVNADTGAYCNYGNDTGYVKTFGRLYNWQAVNDSRNMAPTGWHVSSDAEWTILAAFLGGDSVAGGKIKESGYLHWASPNTGGTNESGFTAFAGGSRTGDASGAFYGLGQYGNLWTSTNLESNNPEAWSRELGYQHAKIIRDTRGMRNGFSVRCVKD